jgi:hypothetical protein
MHFESIWDHWSCLGIRWKRRFYQFDENLNWFVLIQLIVRMKSKMIWFPGYSKIHRKIHLFLQFNNWSILFASWKINEFFLSLSLSQSWSSAGCTEYEMSNLFHFFSEHAFYASENRLFISLSLVFFLHAFRFILAFKSIKIIDKHTWYLLSSYSKRRHLKKTRFIYLITKCQKKIRTWHSQQRRVWIWH